ncbi:MAG: FRG domain-containing protein [Planctomycetota bacterium]
MTTVLRGETKDISSWEVFVEELNKIQILRAQRKAECGRSGDELLFRGQGDSRWLLETTLERTLRRMGKVDCSLEQYYRWIHSAHAQIETFSDRDWEIPDCTQYGNFLKEAVRNDLLLFAKFPGYDYMVYLRHHGFPSPLLDWTRSPQVAAYFAFREADVKKTEKVSLYVLWESTGKGKSWTSAQPYIWSLGPYVRSHRRHFLQQCEYTICVEERRKTSERVEEWYYMPHESVFKDNTEEQDLLWKFSIPSSERLKVLKILDNLNVNALSLFGSEESLMETMAMREIEFRG